MNFLKFVCKFFRPIVFLLMALGILGTQQLNAQGDGPSEEASIELMAGVRDGKILVKAFPKTKEAWYFATRKGIRFSFARMQDGVWGAFVPLQGQAVRPAAAESFDQFAGEGAYAKIMKAVIHEQDYVPESQLFSDIHAANKEFSSQFIFYIMMSCYHPELSAMSGLQIAIPAELSGNMRIRAEVEGKESYWGELVFNSHELASTVPGPPLELLPGDLKVESTWEHQPYAKNIMAYQTYRSDNGVQYEPLGVPIIYNASSAYGKKGMITSSDSLPKNYKDYWYKLRGYDVFGYQTAEQPAVKVRGTDNTAPGRIKQLSVVQTSPTEAALQWVHQAEDGFAGYQVVGSTAELGEYQKLHDQLLPENQTYFQYNLTAGFYKFYRVMAVDTAYNASVSDIAYLVEVDTVPPPIPVFTSASCDTSRVITLSWEPSTAPDIKGYRVFKAFHPSHGFHPITPVAITSSTFSDTLSKRLEKKVYYQIIALDTHYNHSRPSEYTAVAIPDMISPTPPLLHEGKLNDMGQPEIHWKASSSNDVEKYTVYRLVDRDSMLSDQFEIGPEERSFSDATFSDLGVKYGIYAVTATDSSGNESERSNVMRVFGERSKTQKTILVNTAEYDGSSVVISWPNDNRADGSVVLIYRAKNEENYTLLGKGSAAESYVDKQIQPGQTYRYKLGVLESSGKRWPMSEPIDVRTYP